MKVHIISLLALLISSKANAKDLDESLTSLPGCWKAGGADGGLLPTNDSWCIVAYHTCLQALEDDNSMLGDHSPSYYTEGATECAQAYGDFYPVQDLKEACIDKWDQYCHDKKLWGFHLRHRRNACRRNFDTKCTAIYGTY